MKVLSLNNTQLAWIAKLLHKKHRRRSDQFLVDGVRLCSELVHSPAKVHGVIFTPKLLQQQFGNQLLQESSVRGIPIFQTTEPKLRRLSDTCNPQPVAAWATTIKYRLMDIRPSERRFLVLVDISDPGNMGTLIRTAEAFAWNSIICIGNTAELYNPKVLRAAMGGAFRLPIVYSSRKEVLSFFEDTNVSYVVSMPSNGIVPPLKTPPERLALFLGNEAWGLPQELANNAYASVQLPMSNGVNSLNVAVAGGILLFLLR